MDERRLLFHPFHDESGANRRARRALTAILHIRHITADRLHRIGMHRQAPQRLARSLPGRQELFSKGIILREEARIVRPKSTAHSARQRGNRHGQLGLELLLRPPEAIGQNQAALSVRAHDLDGLAAH